MKIGHFDLDHDILIVAEIGNNHEGSYTLAEELIGRAKEAGVGAVKFQTFHTETFVSHMDQNRYRRLKSFELSHSEFEKLSQVARQEGLLFLSTPLDIESVHFLNPLVPAFKIASADNTFYPLIEEILATRKPILLSSGFMDVVSLQKVVSFIHEKGNGCDLSQTLAILQCVSSYPVPSHEANLRAIAALQQAFLDATIGYSDHTIGWQACLIAVALGARIIEKHFTLDKQFSDFRDHALSADPAEMKKIVEEITLARELLGNGNKEIQAGERELLPQCRRSIIAKRALEKGHLISKQDLAWVRPSFGLPPGQENLLIGKYLLTEVKAGEALLPEFVNERFSQKGS